MVWSQLCLCLAVTQLLCDEAGSCWTEMCKWGGGDTRGETKWAKLQIPWWQDRAAGIWQRGRDINAWGQCHNLGGTGMMLCASFLHWHIPECFWCCLKTCRDHLSLYQPPPSHSCLCWQRDHYDILDSEHWLRTVLCLYHRFWCSPDYVCVSVGGRSFAPAANLTNVSWYDDYFLKCLILIEVCACMLSCFSRVQCFAILWTVAARLLCPWSSPGKNTRAVCHALLQGLFATQESNACLLQCWQILYYWATREAPTEVQLSYNIVLVLGVQHSYWVTHTHTHISFSDSFPI